MRAHMTWCHLITGCMTSNPQNWSFNHCVSLCFFKSDYDLSFQQNYCWLKSWFMTEFRFFNFSHVSFVSNYGRTEAWKIEVFLTKETRRTRFLFVRQKICMQIGLRKENLQKGKREDAQSGTILFFKGVRKVPEEDFQKCYHLLS